MKTITKRIKDEIFVWDQNAFLGKGYWFVLGTKGGYGRAASKAEAKKLGNPVEEKPVTKKTSNKKIKDVIEENLNKDKSVGRSINSDIAKNVTKLIDVKKDKSNIKNVSTAGVGKVGNIDTAKYTSVSESQTLKLKRGEGVANILAKIYIFLKKTHEEDIKRMEMERNFHEKIEKEKDKWNDELIAAITGNKNTKAVTTKIDTSKQEDGLLGSIMNIITGIAKSVSKIVEKIGETVLDIIKSIPIFSLLLRSAGWLLGALFSPEALIAVLIGAGLWASYELYKKLNREPTEEEKIEDNKMQRRIDTLAELKDINPMFKSFINPRDEDNLKLLVESGYGDLLDPTIGFEAEALKKYKSKVVAPVLTNATPVTPAGAPIPTEQNKPSATKMTDGTYKLDEVVPNSSIDERMRNLMQKGREWSSSFKKPQEQNYSNVASGILQPDPKKSGTDNFVSPLNKEEEEAFNLYNEKLESLGQDPVSIEDLKLKSVKDAWLKIVKNRGLLPDKKSVSSIDTPNQLSQRAQASTNQYMDNQMVASIMQPIIVNNSKVVGSGSGGGGSSIGFDSSVSTRTDDNTLRKVQFQSTRRP